MGKGHLATHNVWPGGDGLLPPVDPASAAGLLWPAPWPGEGSMFHQNGTLQHWQQEARQTTLPPTGTGPALPPLRRWGPGHWAALLWVGTAIPTRPLTGCVCPIGRLVTGPQSSPRASLWPPRPLTRQRHRGQAFGRKGLVPMPWPVPHSTQLSGGGGPHHPQGHCGSGSRPSHPQLCVMVMTREAERLSALKAELCCPEKSRRAAWRRMCRTVVHGRR